MASIITPVLATFPEPSTSQHSQHSDTGQPVAQHALQAAVAGLADVLAPHEADQDARNSLVQQLSNLLASSTSLQHVTVTPYGSSASGLYLVGSDLDVALGGSVDPAVLRAKGAALNLSSPTANTIRTSQLASSGRALSGEPQCLDPISPASPKLVSLETLGHDSQVALLACVVDVLRNWPLADKRFGVGLLKEARVPVAKFRHAGTGLAVDIVCGVHGRALKAGLMQQLTRLAPMLPALYRLVKLWAMAHDLNDAGTGTFNSWSLSLMVLFSLQTCRFAPLPQLWRLFHAKPPSQQSEVRLLQQPGITQAFLQDQLQRCIARCDQLCGVKGGSAGHGSYGSCSSTAPGVSTWQLLDHLHWFMALWANLMQHWQDGTLRDHRVSVWLGRVQRQPFMGVPYRVLVEDPLDNGDNTARSLGVVDSKLLNSVPYVTHVLQISEQLLRAARTTGSAQDVQVAFAWLFGPAGLKELQDSTLLAALGFDTELVSEVVDQASRQDTPRTTNVLASPGKDADTPARTATSAAHSLSRDRGQLVRAVALLLPGCRLLMKHVGGPTCALGKRAWMEKQRVDQLAAEFKQAAQVTLDLQEWQIGTDMPPQQHSGMPHRPPADGWQGNGDAWPPYESDAMYEALPIEPPHHPFPSDGYAGPLPSPPHLAYQLLPEYEEGWEEQHRQQEGGPGIGPPYLQVPNGYPPGYDGGPECEPFIPPEQQQYHEQQLLLQSQHHGVSQQQQYQHAGDQVPQQEGYQQLPQNAAQNSTAETAWNGDGFHKQHQVDAWQQNAGEGWPDERQGLLHGWQGQQLQQEWHHQQQEQQQQQGWQQQQQRDWADQQQQQQQQQQQGNAGSWHDAQEQGWSNQQQPWEHPQDYADHAGHVPVPIHGGPQHPGEVQGCWQPDLRPPWPVRPLPPDHEVWTHIQHQSVPAAAGWEPLPEGAEEEAGSEWAYQQVPDSTHAAHMQHGFPNGLQPDMEQDAAGWQQLPGPAEQHLSGTVASGMSQWPAQPGHVHGPPAPMPGSHTPGMHMRPQWQPGYAPRPYLPHAPRWAAPQTMQQAPQNGWTGGPGYEGDAAYEGQGHDARAPTGYDPVPEEEGHPSTWGYQLLGHHKPGDVHDHGSSHTPAAAATHHMTGIDQRQGSSHTAAAEQGLGLHHTAAGEQGPHHTAGMQARQPRSTGEASIVHVMPAGAEDSWVTVDAADQQSWEEYEYQTVPGDEAQAAAPVSQLSAGSAAAFPPAAAESVPAVGRQVQTGAAQPQQQQVLASQQGLATAPAVSLGSISHKASLRATANPWQPGKSAAGAAAPANTPAVKQQ